MAKRVAKRTAKKNPRWVGGKVRIVPSCKGRMLDCDLDGVLTGGATTAEFFFDNDRIWGTFGCGYRYALGRSKSETLPLVQWMADCLGYELVAKKPKAGGRS